MSRDRLLSFLDTVLIGGCVAALFAIVAALVFAVVVGLSRLIG